MLLRKPRTRRQKRALTRARLNGQKLPMLRRSSRGLLELGIWLSGTVCMVACGQPSNLRVASPVDLISRETKAPICTQFLKLTPPCEPRPEFTVSVTVDRRHRGIRGTETTTALLWKDSDYLIGLDVPTVAGDTIAFTVEGTCRSGEPLRGTYTCNTTTESPAELLGPAEPMPDQLESSTKDGVSKPVLLAGPSQPRARSAEMQGLAFVSCVLTERGVPTHCKVVRSTSPGLGAAVLEMVRAQLFVPARYRGKRTPVLVTFPIRVRPTFD